MKLSGSKVVIKKPKNHQKNPRKVAKRNINIRVKVKNLNENHLNTVKRNVKEVLQVLHQVDHLQIKEEK